MVASFIIILAMAAVAAHAVPVPSIGLDKREEAAAPWYMASPASDAAGIDRREEAAAPWYVASPASDAAGLDKREEAAAPWHVASPASDVAGLDKRDSNDDAVINSLEKLKKEAFGNVRNEHLRVSAAKGKAFFQFPIHPKNDTVDRWHVPAVIQNRYDDARDDSDRVSLLNFYLYETGREPKPAAELGFKPTMTMPGLPDNGNEVGYGYALAGQHQSHCGDFLADAIEIGKANINDFYLFHVVHCLSLIKIYALELKGKEPLTPLTPQAQSFIKSHHKETIN